MIAAPSVVRANPFVGLRPFESGDTHLFFGRDRQIDELLTRLRSERFVAVLGTSGSGKSSLIRAGLLPALEGGVLTRSAGAAWRVAILRPGGDPIRNLAVALDCADVWKLRRNASGDAQDILDAVLRRGSLGLVDAVRESDLAADEALLVVVDQFEELFRFKRVAAPESRDDAAAFVKILLEATRHAERRTHVVVTMRSEFLGNCSEFRDLPEAINEGLFLIPRLNRDQLAQAITGPIAVAGSRIAPSLVQQLLNDVGDDPDQLPVLQHVLMRMWDCRGQTDMLTLEHYKTVKGMQEALSDHADEAFHELGPAHQRVAEQVFRCLTERGPDSREVRRPTRLSELAETTGASHADVITVVDRFRLEGRSFLTPPITHLVTSETVIDISHESLIRKWSRLRAWVNQEAEDRRIYLRVAESAAGHAAGQEPLWRDPRLTWALQWRERFKPTEGWASRYAPGLNRAMAFLDKSLAERRGERRRRRAKTYGAVAGLLLVAAGGWAYLESQREQRARAAQAADKEAHERADRERENEQLREQTRLADVSRNLEAEKRLLAEQQSELDREKARSSAILAETAGARLQEVDRLFQRQVANFADRAATASPAGPELASLVALHVVRRAQDGGDSQGIANAQRVLSKNLLMLPIIRWRVGLGRSVSNLAVAPGGELLAVDAQSSEVLMWDVTTVQPKPLPVPQIDQGAKYVQVTANGRRVLWTAGQNLRVWDSDSGETMAIADPSFQQAMSFATPSAPGKVLVSGSNGTRLWDLGTRQFRELDRDQFTTLAFSPDEKTIVGARPGLVRVWNAETAQVHGDFSVADKSAFQQIVFSPRGAYFAAATAGGSLHVWTMADGVPSAVPMSLPPSAQKSLAPPDNAVHTQRVNDVAFSHDERFIATASDDQSAAILRIPGDRTGSMRKVAQVRHEGSVRRVAFSPVGHDSGADGVDEYLLATGGGDNTARIWRLAADDRLVNVTELYRVLHKGAVRAVAFLRNGDFATGDGTGWLQAVRVTSQTAKAQTQDLSSVEGACARLSRNLTAQEWNTFFSTQPYRSPCKSLPLDPVEVLELVIIHAEAKEVDAAMAAQRQLRDLPPSARLNPRRVVTAASLQFGVGNRNDARELFRVAVRLSESLMGIDDKDKAVINNHTCWQGVIRDFADDVWSACVQAVTLDKDAFGHVDSRGVAYALKGDVSNALADFREYVARGKALRSKEMIGRRERWIQELAAGRNPFAPKIRDAVLEELRNERNVPIR